MNDAVDGQHRDVGMWCGSFGRGRGCDDRGAITEPWLRGTLREVDAVRRQVLHALELAGEDAERWCRGAER